jgi:predicted transcriptional regulator
MEEPTGRQIKAARALLGWSKAELGRMADVSVTTIARLEGKAGRIGGRLSTATNLVVTLKTAGIEFLNVNEKAVGVLLVRESTEIDS